MRVELLRDRKGVYGIGPVRPVEPVAEAPLIPRPILPHPQRPSWAEPVAHPGWADPPPLILRPDRFHDCPVKGSRAVLQMITGGFPFWHSSEERLRQIILQEALKRAGLAPCCFWQDIREKTTNNRRIFFGLLRSSQRVINTLIGKALEEAAHGDAIKAARRFTFRNREMIYRAAAVSRNALQLTETFPLLALAVYTSNHWAARYVDFLWPAGKEPEDLSDRISEASRLIERGARLREVAAAMGIPMALRYVKPGAAHLVSHFLCQRPELLRSIPGTTAQQRIWLSQVRLSFGAGADFDTWVAKHTTEIPGSCDQVHACLSDIGDWVARGNGAVHPNRPSWARLEGEHPDLPVHHHGVELITRLFHPSMSLRTAMALSAEWHEAVATAEMEGPNATFPAPWFPATRIGDFEILPIEDAVSLHREGKAMHHCVDTYRDKVLSGECCIYSIRHDGKRIATLALARTLTLGRRRRKDDQASILLIRGPCNALVSKSTARIVRQWLRRMNFEPRAADSAQQDQRSLA